MTDLSGTKFGSWTVLKNYYEKKSAVGGRATPYWECACECGLVKWVSYCSLITGRSVRCKKCAHKLRLKYLADGTLASKHPLYKTWISMRQRCSNPKGYGYRNYGGRGIYVHESWLNFEKFASDMVDRPTPSHQLDRIDNDGPYSKENCKWSTPTENGRNKRTNRMILFEGRNATVAEWAEITGINILTIHKRLSSGWGLSDVFSKCDHSLHYITFDGKTLCISEWAKLLGLHVQTIHQRILAGRPVNEILYAGDLKARTLTYNGETKRVFEWAAQLNMRPATIHSRIKLGLPIECILATNTIQGHIITYNGVSKNIKGWAAYLGVSEGTLSRRIKLGWDIELVLSPRSVRGHTITYNGISKNITEWAAELGIAVSALYDRLKSGWSIERAFTEKSKSGRRVSRSKK